MRLVGRWFLVALAFGCSKSTPAPTLAPSWVVYRIGGTTDSQLVAVPEDGSRAFVTLSGPGASGRFITALPGQRALVLEHDSELRLVAVAADGSSRHVMARLPAGTYGNASRALVAGDALVAEMVIGGDVGVSDVVVARENTAPLVLFHGATVVAADDRRAVVLADSLSSAALDGSDVRTLGTGNDRVAAVDGGRILFTTGTGEARLTDFAGHSTSLGTGVAFALAGARAVVTRGDSMVSVAVDGTDARVLAVGVPVTVAGDQLVYRAGTALLAVPLLGGASRTLDPDLGGTGSGFRVAGSSLFYVAQQSGSPVLRAASLAGGAPAALYVADDVDIRVCHVDSGRVTFQVTPLGDPDQAGGGWLYSAPITGGALEHVGTSVHPVDQDFEAVTPSGRLIVEVETGRPGIGPQLVTTAPATAAAQGLTAPGSRFAGLVP